MLIEKIWDTIINNDLIEKGEHIVVGLSGGPDSICLFHALHRLSTELDIKLHGVHINHKLRPVAAEEDQAYAEQFCSDLGVPFRCFTFDIAGLARQQGISSEEAGRKARYQAFFETAAALPGKKKIAVAQNLNDQAETVLMRILRGTGIDGLSGIEYKRGGEGGIPIIRPLLDIPRQEIEDYCREHQLHPRIDLTNLEPVYTRNKVRLELLPYLEKGFNSNIMETLNRLSKIAKEDKAYFSDITDNAIRSCAEIICPSLPPREDGMADGNEIKKSACIHLERFTQLHPAVQNRVLIRLLGMIGLDRDLSAVHLEAAKNLIAAGKTSSSLDLPGGYKLRISYGNAELFRVKNDRATANVGNTFHNNRLTAKIVEASETGMLSPQTGHIVTAPDKPGSKTQAFDYEKINETGCEPVLRTRKQGDWIRPKGMQGKKKLQDFFVDAKIKREMRDFTPLVCLGSEVIWIVGHRSSESYTVTGETKTILLLECCVDV